MRTICSESSATSLLSQNLSNLRTLSDSSEEDERCGSPPLHLQACAKGEHGLIREDRLLPRFLEVASRQFHSTRVVAHGGSETSATIIHGRYIKSSDGDGTSDVDQSVPPTSSETEPCPCLKVKHLCLIFPFHVVMNHHSEILQTGPALSFLFDTPESLVRDRLSFADCFDILHPVCRPSSDLSAFLDPDQPLTMIVQPKVTPAFIRLKGQLHSLPYSSMLLFLPFPLPENDTQDDCTRSRDLVRRDLTRDLENISQAVRRERRARHRLRLVVADLRDQMSKFEADKVQTDELLSSIFPSAVAERLRLGRPVDPVTFDLVTILFADIVQFTALCGDIYVTPMDVVRMLNQLYTQFDLLSSLNDVYKVMVDHVNGCMDGRMYGWFMDGWVGRWMDG